MREIIKENFSHIRQTIFLSRMDLIKFYKGAALGYVWSVIKPLVTISVYLFAFQIGIRNGEPMDGYPFVLWLIAGIIPWFFISDAIITGTTAIRLYKQFVTKIKFPVSTIPTFVLLSKLYVQLLLLIPVVILFLLYGFKIDVYYIQFLYYIPTMYIFFVVLSWSFASISVMSKDFENLIKSSLQALLWLSPILWNIDAINSNVLRFILNLNPINYFVQGYRNIFLYKEWFFHSEQTLYIWGLIFVLAILGANIYKKLHKEFADVL